MINNGEGFEVSAGKLTVTGRRPPTERDRITAGDGDAITAKITVIAMEESALNLIVFRNPYSVIRNRFYEFNFDTISDHALTSLNKDV